MRKCALIFLFLFLITKYGYAQKIDRKSVIKRHDIYQNSCDTLSAITIGNGGFAFTADVTGLQTFYKAYAHGVPLGTQSDWGWHSFPNTKDLTIAQTYKYYPLYGKKDVSYSVQSNEASAAVEYFRVNPHRLQLGNVGFVFLMKNGDTATLKDIKDIKQHLDIYKGLLESQFTVEGVPVNVVTVANQEADGISFTVASPLIKLHRLFVRVAFPYPTGNFEDMGDYFPPTASQQSAFYGNTHSGGTFKHSLDTTRYYVNAHWNQDVVMDSSSNFYYIRPRNIGKSNRFEVNLVFSPTEINNKELFDKVKDHNIMAWKRFWESGGAIDFTGSTDKRAFELERRIILSQYLTKVQCAGIYPPQETGLTYNSWYGKPHLEMYWWHAAHFAFWGRPQLLEKSFDWFITVAGKAKAIASRQGFDGVRWQKMTSPQGDESPASVGNFLIWQQPHFIYLAELLYRTMPQKAAMLSKYGTLVAATADFMASFVVYDTATHHYNLGKGLIPAQECFNPFDTYNPPYELAYWSWALKVAQEWRVRSGLPRKQAWDDVINHLSPLPQQDGLYLAAGNATDSYSDASHYTKDHPAVLAALATIPVANGLDTAIMHHTFDTINKVWHWETTWGWDYPLMAMTATRLQLKDQAVDMLMRHVQKNTYLPNGNNYQDNTLRIYLPGNGGLLSAIALMCAGYDGCPVKTPGFNNQTWRVKWEGLNPMP
ncbi:hypothetical protein GA0116948_10551 [Chitinophaga costaii]|uniref:Glycosyl hydrolase family 65, N-terminal domain n=1 Tax=Chitinophaga costaii TaxID=1335309 RepID=A0A1C4D3K0_9BACT|nr:hypothetical protein [Chitinophaga costaii]PUZ24444.1 hypothetical protein DCM91_11040 [Chitinophaga costaii]SCC25887.1 hypothetical protein GA0116948_10551 [Chitinophaga costaii]